MTPKKQIFWHQGLFLQPQHFQQAEQYQRSLLTPINQYRQPFCWGVRAVELNESALINRVVEITGLEAIFQDFSWVMAGENCSLQARSFADQENAFTEEDSFTVYLGLKRWDRLGINVEKTGNRDRLADTRFVCAENPQEQADLYDQGPPAQISFMEHNLKIFWQSELESLGDYHLIPLLRLKMSGDNILLDKSYVPPTLTLESSHLLLQVVKNIREQMLARCRVLEAYKPLAGQEVNSLEMASLYYLFALNTLNRYVVQLQHHLAQPLIHPWQLHGILRQLVGELSTFSDRMNGLAQLRDGQELLSEYDHLDAGSSYREVQQLIGELLDGIVIGSESIFILTREADRFCCELPAEILAERQLYCLIVRTAQEAEELVNTFVHHVKTGSRKSMDTLVSRSLNGVGLVYREIPPLGIVRRQGCFCFELDSESSQWLEVEKEATLCLHWDQAPEDATMELVVTRL
ncbi:type VI secretion system baseplate subunit TssK [Desulfogranum mediterraneum]|uniref:type VI secretion system baseplate subunit TssK n=1 Tax=Desulfogranum mediterraneum TaxID=160661 RepID=UPI00040D5738|nr:type VI secretion system baseplate subunit TssK [Desulfogranum mediterraneum]